MSDPFRPRPTLAKSSAPPVYRPVPASSGAPPVYKPVAAAQLKRSTGARFGAPPPYRPAPSPRAAPPVYHPNAPAQQRKLSTPLMLKPPVVQRTIVGMEGQPIWGTEIAGRVVNESNPSISKEVHRLHDSTELFPVASYDDLVSKITSPRSSALKKAIDDFDKLPEKWQNVRRYSFVMNDRFQGIPAPIGSSLQGLQIKKKLEFARGFPMKDLMDYFMQLTLDKRQDIIGGIPAETVTFIDYRAVSELLSSLADNAPSSLSFLTDTAPQFDEKIKFNGLTSPVSSKLEVLSYQVTVIDDFLNARDSGLRQAIAQEIRGYYQESKTVILDTSQDAANRRYFWLVDKLIPPNLPAHPHSLAAYRTAAELVIAKYFETCDAYEHPDSPSPA
jgi:hypothetical protein